jgi:hypothetical protein
MTVAVFFWGTSAVVALDARKEKGPARWPLFGVAVVLALLGCLVWTLWPRFPVIYGAVGQVATFYPSWFFLAGIAYISWRSRRIPASMPADDQPKIPTINEIVKLQSRVASLEGEVKDGQDSSGNTMLRILERVQKLEEGLSKTERSIMIGLQRVEAAQSLDNSYMRTQVASLYDSLAAVYHRERLGELAKAIESKAEELSFPTNEKLDLDEDSWPWWEARYLQWKAIVEEWTSLADSYSEGIGKKVLDIHPDQFQQKGQATAAQFPDTESFIIYKGFWIVLKQWQNWRQEAERAVHQVAFNGGTAGSRPIFPGGGEMEELGARGQ